MGEASKYYTPEELKDRSLADDVIESECAQEAFWQYIAGELSLVDFELEIDRIKEIRESVRSEPECMDDYREKRERGAS